MKEATGEASMTGITIGVIAIVAAIAIPIVTNLITSLERRSCCASYGGELINGDCKITTSGNNVSNVTNWWDTSSNQCKE